MAAAVRKFSHKSMGNPSKELKEQIRAREKQLAGEERAVEKTQVKGRWVTDENAMNRTDVKLRERHSRAVPKKLAKMNMLALEDSRNGLVPEEGEVTDRLKQQDILDAVDHQTQRKRFDLTLNQLGPYRVDFSTNGSSMLLCGLRGHMASFGCDNFNLQGETQLKDKCTDAKFCIDHSTIAVAQKRFVYMYTKEGAEMHILSKMANMTTLEMLPKHQLLVASSNTFSTIAYLDVSTGKEVSIKPPSLCKDPAMCMRQNPANAVVATCDTRGIVKMWSPTVMDPLVQIKAHSGAIQDICFTQNGRHFVTLGTDRKMKVWDARMLRTLEDYPVTYTFTTIDISSTGLLAMGGGTKVEVWKNLFSASKQNTPYMKHGLGYANVAETVRFRPFEDTLGVGHANGFSSILVPGAGESNPDFYQANPYETEMHRKERVVKSLLDKLAPDTIGMDLRIGDIDEKALDEYAKNLAANRKAKRIKDKKARRADTSKGEDAPSGVGLTSKSGDIDDELDEELGVKERGAVKQWKTKKELQKEKKKARWDKKDSSDKVRSKQNMRHSRQVQKERHLRRLKKAENPGASADGEEDPADDYGGRPDEDPSEDVDAPAKKRGRAERREEQRGKALEKWGGSAALRRFA